MTQKGIEPGRKQFSSLRREASKMLAQKDMPCSMSYWIFFRTLGEDRPLRRQKEVMVEIEGGDKVKLRSQYLCERF